MFRVQHLAFPPQVKVPLCTLAETPRTAARCIEYAHLIKRDEVLVFSSCSSLVALVILDFIFRNAAICTVERPLILMILSICCGFTKKYAFIMFFVINNYLLLLNN